MVRLTKYLLVLLIAGLAAGCDDFLENTPQGNLNQASFPRTKEDAVYATNAVYNTLRNWHFHSGGYPILDVMSDDAVKGSNPSDQISTVGPYDNFQINAGQDGLDRWYKALYQGIKRANVVIEFVPAIDMNVTLRDRLIGEAKFLRALFYFDLVRAWGGVPIVTTTTPPLHLGRSSEDEVYNLIEEDLKAAADVLPEQSVYASSDLGRATKGAAKGILAKVYLFQNDFVNAETYAMEVINSGQYQLDPDFSNVFSQSGEYGVGSIFEIGAIGSNGTSNGGNQYANTQGVRGTPNRGWGFNRPSVDLINSFDPDDPRMDATIIFLGEVLDGVTILGDGTTPDVTYTDASNTVIKEIECYNQKVWVPGTNTLTQWGHNRRVLRYADVLLMAAEALNENNKASEALVYINMVRERARGGDSGILPDITETNKTALRDLIIQERRFELALEGHRFWDLVRTGKALSILGPLGYIDGKNDHLPLPQTEIDLSEGALEQDNVWN